MARVLQLTPEEWRTELRDLYAIRDGYLKQREVILSYRRFRSTTTQDVINHLQEKISRAKQQLEALESYLSIEGEDIAREYYWKAMQMELRILVLTQSWPARENILQDKEFAREWFKTLRERLMGDAADENPSQEGQ